MDDRLYSYLEKIASQVYAPIVWALFTGTAQNGFSMSIVTPFISVHLYAYEDSPVALIGLVVFLQTISNAVMQLAGGELCDRFGRKPVFMAGLAGVSMSFTGLVFIMLLK